MANISMEHYYNSWIPTSVVDNYISGVSVPEMIVNNTVTSSEIVASNDGGGQITSAGAITSEYIISKMNDTQFSILIPSFILVLILLVLGVTGNTIALTVYLTKMKRSTASYFIITLAFSDLTNCAVSLPVELFLITHFWSFDFPWICKFSRFLTLAMNNTSSFILAAIAVERFRSICLPLKPRLTSLCAKLISLSLSLFAVLSAVPMIFCYGTFTHSVTVYNITAHGKTCLIEDSVVNTSYPTLLLIFVFTGHMIIFLILAILYSCIVRRLIARTKFSDSDMTTRNGLLQRHNSAYSITSFTFQSKTSVRHLSVDKDQYLEGKGKLIRSTSSQSNIDYNLSRKHGGHTMRTKRLTCMLFLVTSVFEISFIPYLVIVWLRYRNPLMYNSLSVPSKMAYQFFLRSYLINSAINPIIYCFYNQNFRHGVKRLFHSIRKSFVKEGTK